MREHVLPLALSILITFLVLGPIVFAFVILARQSQAWLTEISITDKGGLLAPSWLRATPMVGTRLADAWNDAASTRRRRWGPAVAYLLSDFLNIRSILSLTASQLC